LLLPDDWTRFIGARLIAPWLPRRRAWRREIGPGLPRELIAELLAQHTGADFFDFAFTKLPELKWPE